MLALHNPQYPIKVAIHTSFFLDNQVPNPIAGMKVRGFCVAVLLDHLDFSTRGLLAMDVAGKEEYKVKQTTNASPATKMVPIRRLKRPGCMMEIDVVWRIDYQTKEVKNG